ncbi:hypothetical protein [Dyella flagellata]|nr:hypothetical protein [Dyella flagellata]
MASLGLFAKAATGYQNPFGITLKPSPIAISGDGARLLGAASDVSSNATMLPKSTSTENDGMATSGSKWLTGIVLSVALSATSAATAHATSDYALGRCDVVDTITVGTDSPGTHIDPISDANSYIVEYQNQSGSPLREHVTDQSTFEHATITTLSAPKHGKLIWDPNTGPNISAADEGWYYYLSNKGYSGEDTFVMQIERHGLKIKIYYTIEVWTEGLYDQRTNPQGFCDPDEWKISKTEVEGAAGTSFTPDAPLPASFAVGQLD